MEHKKKQYQEPTLDIIKMRPLPCLQTGSNDPAEEQGDGAREYYYTDPFHYLYDINE